MKKLFIYLFLICNILGTEKEIDDFNQKLSQRDTQELSEKIAILLLGSGAKKSDQNRERYILSVPVDAEDSESDEYVCWAIYYCCGFCCGILR